MRKLCTDHVKYMLGKKKELFTGKYESPQSRSNFYKDRVLEVQEMLEYMTFLVRNLPEFQLRKVLTAKTLEPLIDAILTGESSEWRKLPYYKPEKQSRVTNPRIFNIAWMLFQKGRNKAWNLLPNDLVSSQVTAGGMGGFDKSRIVESIGLYLKISGDANEEKKKG